MPEPEIAPLMITTQDTPFALGPGQHAAHAFEVEDDTPQFIHAVVEQLGLDVVLQLVGPGEQAITTVDSPIGDRGEETIVAIVDEPGPYRLVVRASDHGAAGDAALTFFAGPREPTQADRLHVEADRAHRSAWRSYKDERYEASAAAYREAIRLWRRLGMNAHEADSLDGLALVLEKQKRHEAALVLFEQAVELLVRTDDTLRERDRYLRAQLLDRVGSHWRLHRDEPQTALDVGFEPALAIANELDRPILRASIHTHAGRAHHALGSFQPALDHYEAALRNRVEVLDRAPKIIYDALTRKASALIALFAFEEALATARDAQRAATRLDRPLSAARASLQVGLALARLDRFEEAEVELQRALPTFEAAGGIHPFNAWTAIGDLERRRGALGESRGAFRRALRIAQRRGKPKEEAHALIELANLDRLGLDPAAALEKCQRALAALATIHDPRWTAAAHARAAEALRDLDQLTAAAQRIDQALAGVEALRAATIRFGRRSQFFAFRQEYYDIALDIRVRQWRAEPTDERAWAALAVHEQRMARELLESIARPEPTVADPERQSSEQALTRTLGRLATSQDLPSQARQQAIDETIANLQTLRDAARRTPEPTPIERLATSPEAMASRLGASTAVVVFSVGPETSHRWLLDSRHPERVDLEILETSAEALAEHVGRFRHLLLGGQQSERRALAALGAEVARALRLPLDDLPRRLVLVADGVLSGLPWAALPLPRPAEPSRQLDRAPYLVEATEIVLVPSIETLLQMQRANDDRPAALRPALVVSDPVFGTDDDRYAGPARGQRDPTGPRETPDRRLRQALTGVGLSELARLPETVREAAAIVDHLPIDGSVHLTGFQASVETLERLTVSDFGIIHFATHAIANFDRPDLSGVVLSRIDVQGRARRGFLPAAALPTLGFDADLVVLSGCETALGKRLRAEGTIGFGRRFLASGTSRVIASLWPVPDRGTAALMTRFHRLLWQSDESVAAVLQQAQRAMLADPRTADPYFWAGFSFHGDWRRPSGWYRP